MIPAGMTIKEWLKRYPELDLLNSKCNACNQPMTECKPFRDRNYAGIESLPCKCGKNFNKWSSAVTITKEEHERWNKILGEV